MPIKRFWSEVWEVLASRPVAARDPAGTGARPSAPPVRRTTRATTGPLAEPAPGPAGRATRKLSRFDRVNLTAPDGSVVPGVVRRALLGDLRALEAWPEPGFFDWAGLLTGTPRREGRAGVDYGKPLLLFAVEADGGVVGMLGLAEGPGTTEVAYLETLPNEKVKGVGLVAMAFASDRARRLGHRLFLDALLKSGCTSFYERLGMVEVPGTPWPTRTVRMAFPDDATRDRFLAEAYRKVGMGLGEA